LLIVVKFDLFQLFFEAGEFFQYFFDTVSISLVVVLVLFSQQVHNRSIRTLKLVEESSFLER
jgi:heme exporter protein D